MTEPMKLAPCPFCGAQAEYERIGTQRHSCIVKCTNCGCRLETGETWNSGHDWNKRTLSVPAPQSGMGDEQAGRDARQATVVSWASAAFGTEQTTNIEQRGLRLAEETIEACQAAGCDAAMLHKLIDYVYSRPVGAVAQELGGVGLCTLAMANAAGLSADAIEQAEVARVLAKPIRMFSARNKDKNDAGFLASALNRATDGDGG